ncbi:lysine transporter LysE [Microbacterium sp. Y-01]|uniref:LysE family translocator n=1 Tax=Microbacterium sp. Y-01 TaxID=2048898 RepID=UPI000F5DB6A7|nr:LysE family transporter [Microbacterium sp. Y-01]AZH78477.1 lysine transporter LysE [Microbacterium sp. Y-01]
MTFAVWFSLFTASVVISFTPGAGAINTISNAMNQGWRRSIWGIIGQQIALVVHVAIVAAGVGLLVAQSPLLFNAIRYAGAAYLVYLGIRLILTKPTTSVEDAPTPVDTREGRWSMIRRGFWVNLLNPKAIVFFLAFIPQFIRLDQPPIPQYVTLIVTVIIVDVIVMWGFFAAAARPFRRLTRTVRGQRLLNTIFGILFIVVAAILVLLH